MWKSLGAVLAGYIVMLILTLLFFGVLGQLHPDGFDPEMKEVPGTGVQLLILAFGFLSAVGGGWITARLAPGSVGKHVLALVLLVAAMSVVTMLIPAEPAAPRLYSLGLLVVAVAGVSLGGRWRMARAQPQSKPSA